jgi:hypothetical protein
MAGLTVGILDLCIHTGVFKTLRTFPYSIEDWNVSVYLLRRLGKSNVWVENDYQDFDQSTRPTFTGQYSLCLLRLRVFIAAFVYPYAACKHVEIRTGSLAMACRNDANALYVSSDLSWKVDRAQGRLHSHRQAGSAPRSWRI